MKVDRIPVAGHGAGVKVTKGKPGGANGVAVAAALANGGGGGSGGGGTRKRMAAYRRPHPHRRRIMSSAGPIQRLFEACKYVFKGPGTVPSPDDVKALRDILDTMSVEDVGLRRDLPFFQPSSSSDDSSEGNYKSSHRPTMPRKIIRTIIHNKKNQFELSIFLLPSGAVIPLHNHPGMTVFSKLLLGSLHVKSYDWVDPPADPTPGANSGVRRLAKLKSDGDISAPCSTSVLYPTTGGNMHTFKAITPCVVLDVLGPPYSSEDGRDCSYYRDQPCVYSSEDGKDCSYYRDQPCSSSEGGVYEIQEPNGGCDVMEDEDRYALLEEVEEPDDLFDLLFYMGPQVMDG